jgi:subtilisin family serine protease
MPSVWDKIDTGLAIIYDNYLRFRAGGREAVRPLPVVAEGGKLHVSLLYQEALQPAEDAGFKTIFDDGNGQATGVLGLEDLESIAALAEVLSIRYGREPQISLDVSIPQIDANKVWTLTPPATFTGTTGAGALVGVMDTGVDIHHPFLWLQSKPLIKTRILRIWDMGLDVTGGEHAPDVGLLDPGTLGPYGVEYTDADINDVLQGVVGPLAIRTKDCSGHGTHVASTAAGDGRFKFFRVGVAPRAELIIVKYLYLAKEPKVGGVEVGPEQRFKDGVTYMRKVAETIIHKPIVINYSAGIQTGAHDGLDPNDDWLGNQFKDATSEGKIFVAAAGNSAGASQHALVEFSAAGSVEIQFELIDTRSPPLKEFGSCVGEDNTQNQFIECFYPSGGATVTGAFKPHGAAAFTAGPALNGGLVSGVIGGHPFSMRHKEEPGAGGLKRNHFQVIVGKIADTLHRAGTYTLRLTATGPVKIHIWCYQYSFDQCFKTKAAPPPAPHVTVAVSDKNLVWSPGCAKNIITVAAYNAEDAPAFPLVWFSSRGPVPSHGVGAPPPKPDIGAPGWKIDAAKSQDKIPMSLGDTVPMQGTSMASPHVTGAVALLLAKKKTLKPSQVLALLQTNALKMPPPVADDLGAGRLNAKKAFDNIPP